VPVIEQALRQLAPEDPDLIPHARAAHKRPAR
jgi:hypothetical protein